MKEYLKRILSCLRRVAIATVISGMAAGIAVAAPSDNLIVVPPTKLPASARQSGDAMLLHETTDGTTFLYIEQNQGSRLAILDVTDPAHIKDAGLVEVDAPGPFDFVDTFGSQAELIRFRRGQKNAVLDLHKARSPILDLTVSGSALADSQLTRDSQVQVVNIAISPELSRVVHLKGIREEITKYDTGTTFLRTDDGLFLIRRPAKEVEKMLRDMDHTN